MSNLKERVNQVGLTQKQLADKVNVTDAHINYILNGKRDISYSLSKKLYKHLGYKTPILVILDYFNYSDKAIKEDVERVLSGTDEDIEEVLAKILINKFEKGLDKKKQDKFIGKFVSIVAIYNQKPEEENA